MRVRISYSVDLEDVPDECARRFQEGLECVGDLHREIESLIDKMDPQNKHAYGWQIKDQIDRCRQNLAKLDIMLADNDSILEGYHQAKEPKENEDVVSEG